MKHARLWVGSGLVSAFLVSLGTFGVMSAPMADADDTSGLVVAAGTVSDEILSSQSAKDVASVAVSDPPTQRLSYADAYLHANAEEQAEILDGGIVPNVGGACSVFWTNSYHRGIKEHFSTVYDVAGKVNENLTQGTSSETAHTMGAVADHGGGSISRDGGSTKTYAKHASQTGLHDESVYNRVNYRKEQYTCVSYKDWVQYSMADWFTDPGHHVTHKNFATCYSHAKDYEFNTENASQVTQSTGVSFPGLSVSARSGFSKSQNIYFHFLVAGHLCGNSKDGPLNSSQLSAKVP